MSRTIVALYDTRSDAEAAVRDLEADGFGHGAPEIVDTASGGWDASAAAPVWTGTGIATDPVVTVDDGGYGYGGTGILARLAGWGVPEGDAHVYAEGVRRGGSLLVLPVEDAEIDRAVAVLERGNMVDTARRSEIYRSSGWTGYDQTVGPYDAASAAEERARYIASTVDSGPRLNSAAGSFREVNRQDAVEPEPARPTEAEAEKDRAIGREDTGH